MFEPLDGMLNRIAFNYAQKNWSDLSEGEHSELLKCQATYEEDEYNFREPVSSGWFGGKTVSVPEARTAARQNCHANEQVFECI